MKTPQKIQRNNNKHFNIIVSFVKNDFIMIVICLLSLLVCVYTIYLSASYQEKINNHWWQQWFSICSNDATGYVPTFANYTFNFRGDYG